MCLCNRHQKIGKSEYERRTMLAMIFLNISKAFPSSRSIQMVLYNKQDESMIPGYGRATPTFLIMAKKSGNKFS